MKFDRSKLVFSLETKTLLYDGIDTKISSRTLTDISEYKYDLSMDPDEFILESYAKALSELREEKLNILL